MSINYKACFPYKELRPEQDAVLKQIAENWDKKKYFILQCDVGTGKSGIAKTAANWSKNAFIITQTKQLQDQYVHDFAHEGNMVSLKGKANYPCNKNPRLNCENGPCSLLKPKARKNMSCMKNCKYYCLRQKAHQSQVVLTSYAYIFRAFDCAGHWKPRELMVFDEAHLLEQQLVEFASFNINPEYINNRWLVFENCRDKAEHLKRFHASGYKENIARLKVIDELLYNKHEELFEDMQNELDGEIDVDKLDEDAIDYLSKTHAEYYELDKLWKKLEVFLEANPEDWVVSAMPDGSLQCTPLNINNLFSQFCDSWADKFIFMSATIIDTEGFIADLGLNPQDCLSVKIDSSFDPSKSPIYYAPVGSMNYEHIDATMPKCCYAIGKILERRKDERGIIHTGNYKVAKRIFTEANLISNDNHNRLLMKLNEETSNRRLIDLHEQSKNTVLLSPSMTTGVDLKDDLSRFQVVVKLPFGSLADPRIKKKCNINPKWYAVEMLKTLIQACGRSTRSADDFSTTYILDASFQYYFDKYKDLLPKNFVSRIQT